MNVKKQLALSLASVGIGAALLGGGTYAWFSSTASISDNTFAAGTLDMEVAAVNGYQMKFDLQGLKPGDYMTRRFDIKNTGSLDIKEVLLQLNFNPETDFSEGTDPDGHVNINDAAGKKASALDYLSQFEFQFFKTEAESPYTTSDMDLLKQLKWRLGKNTVTLRDLYELTQTERIDIAYRNLLNPKSGSDAADDDQIEMKIGFINNEQKNPDGTYVQNKYQGDSIKISFDLEATQWEGIKRDNGDKPAIIVD
ncbi:TasA family protein [Brevibacillus sp. GCM10020057]|uniref:TasA family protein n=1 Tax=Brevibacillus sp. GCM10020057 TaxID=3317327 RepID=UPI003627B9F9